MYLRALQGHSGRNLIDPTLQDNVVIQRCAVNVHSIINSGLIPGCQNLEQQTDSSLPTCGSHGQKTTKTLIRST